MWREMAYSAKSCMVAQGASIGRALSGWIRSAGKSSVPEIANLKRFRSVVGRFGLGFRQTFRSEASGKLAAVCEFNGLWARSLSRAEREFSANSRNESRDEMAVQPLFSVRESLNL
ncbi:MAG: hypothetical protein DWI00_02255 [Planctomycetota bacterium]|nr:MAG: hypothetical protein DWI00_02255 [Planctomycetota bacterium]